MAAPAPSPGRARSSLEEHNLNLAGTAASDVPEKQSRASMVANTTTAAGLKPELTPNRQKRRSMQPRKSILKPMPLFGNEDDTVAMSLTGVYNRVAPPSMHARGEQTIAFGRRVSFAPNAHVRMFEEPVKKPRSSFAAFPRRSSSGGVGTSRRISNVTTSTVDSVRSAAPAQPERFVGEGESLGEEAMDLTASEHSSSEDEGEDGDLSRVSARPPFALGPRSAITGARTSISSVAPPDADESVDMEMTQVVQNGIVRQSRVSTASSAGEADMDMTMSTTRTDASGEEQTMDFTIAVGGIMPHSAPMDVPRAGRQGRASIGYSVPVHDDGSGPMRRIIPGELAEGEEDDEMEMEMTEAYGGVIGADDSLSSNEDGSLHPERERTMTFSFTPGATAPGFDEDDGEAMEMTVAMGGILRRQSQGARSQGDLDDEDDGDAMEMTVAMGGILQRQSQGATGNHTSHSLNASTNPLNISHGTNIFAPPPASPVRAAAGLAGTPSFARATLSSATKSKTQPPAVVEKRNPFAPSPTTPSERNGTPGSSRNRVGMATAGEVAKRLSFGSVGSAGSASRKRARAEGEDTPGATPAKRRFAPGSAIGGLGESVFGSRSSPRKSAGGTPVLTSSTPRKSLSAPLRANDAQRESRFSLQAAEARSPAKSPMLRKMLGVAPLSVHEMQTSPEMPGQGHGHGQVGEDGEFEPATITLAAFLEMAQVPFVEDLSVAGVPRMSRGRRSGGRSTGLGGEKEYALHEYAVAGVQSVFLNMYSWATNKMKADITTDLAELAQIEADCSAHNPPVIRDYLSASDDDKVLFEMTFKAYKEQTNLQARAMWYGWKMGLMERIREDVEINWEGMKEDEARLDDMEAQADDMLPVLRERLAMLQEEVVGEREVVKEIEACDQGELVTLRQAVVEQTAMVKTFQADLSEAEAQLEKLDSTLSDLVSQRNAHESAIAVARGLCDQYTRSDVLRLRDELGSLQALHACVVERVDRDEVVLVFAGEVRLGVGLGGTLSGDRVWVEDVSQAEKGDKEAVWRGGECPSAGLRMVWEGAVRELAGRKGMTVVKLVQHAAQMFNTVQRLRAEIKLLHVHFPLSFRLVPGTGTGGENGKMAGPAFEARAAVLLPELKSKVVVVFAYDAETLMAWPESVGAVHVRVERVYGGAAPESLTDVVRQTCALSHAEGYLGYLVQVCVDVAAV